jgi:hypothetical protein
VDPLILLDQAVAQGRLPRLMARKIRIRMVYLEEAIARVEKASGITYPPYYVEPALPVSETAGEYGQMGVLYARVIPTTATGSLSILVQFTAALIAFGTKGTIDAVAAHEFTHYVDLVRRLNSKDVASDERVSTLYEASYADTDRLVPARLLFSERPLISLVTRKFKGGLADPALNRKVTERWVGKGLPMRRVGTEENVINLQMGVVSAAKFDPAVLAKVVEIQKKMVP